VDSWVELEGGEHANSHRDFDLPLIEPLVLLGVIGQQGTLTIQVPSQTLAPRVENLTTYHQVFVLDANGQRVLGGGHAVVTISDTL